MAEVAKTPQIEMRTLHGITKANLKKASTEGFLFATRKKDNTATIRAAIKITNLEKEDGSGNRWNFKGYLQNEEKTKVSGFADTHTTKGTLRIGE